MDDLLQHPSEMGGFSAYFTEFLGLFSVLFSDFYSVNSAEVVPHMLYFPAFCCSSCSALPPDHLTSILPEIQLPGPDLLSRLRPQQHLGG